MMRILLLFWLAMIVPTLHATTLLVVGDSLSAGYSMMAHQAWPNLLPKALKQRGYDMSVINASISGDTTANGLKRLPDLLSRHHPGFVLIALGANDGLRGFPLPQVETNLRTMIALITKHHAKPLIMQMRVPPNYGKRYSEAFSNIYTKINTDLGTHVLPFFLEKIILNKDFMLDDGLHPSRAAQSWIANYIADQLDTSRLLPSSLNTAP